MRLYLLRHAPALTRREWSQSDSERPLSAEGEGVARSVARRIAALELGLDAIVTSPFERALRTAREVLEALDGAVPLVEERGLEPAEFTFESLGRILAKYPEGSSLMLVGHEPSMTEVMAELLEGGRYSFKKGGLARIDLDPGSTASGALKWFVPPRLLV